MNFLKRKRVKLYILSFLSVSSIFSKYFIVRSQTTTEQQETQSSSLSPKTPLKKETRCENRSRGRHLWNVAVESILEHEKYPPSSTSMTSSSNNNAPMGWYNLTKR